MYTPITPAGRPAMVARAAKEAMAPPGIPGVPTDRSTLARRITIIVEMLTLIPQAFAKNMIIKDMRMETASMFTVAPRGMAILVILLETPISSSMHCLLIGMVAELEQVPNAFNAAGSIALKNFTGLSLPMNLTAPPYTIKANPKNARYRITSWVASEIIVSVPLASTTGTTSFYKALKNIVYKLFYTTSGVIGTPVSVCYTYIVLFIIFGAFLERTGIANFFISFANRLAGWSSGGPAKVAVISSALCGMVSGSSVGNTVTTGSVTIPMMKKTGYKPEFAGAVEAAASTGGQIMPPIMGAAAFLMAEYMNIPYAKVAVKAILPAVLYFTGIFIAVHLEAKKLGLKGMPKSEMVSWGELAKRAYLIIPLALLIFLVSSGSRTMQFSAAVSILAAIVVGFLNKDERLTFGKIVEALEAGAKGAITVAVACAMAGMIAGCITVTGLASILINAIVQMAGDATMIGLLLTMICCIILGMGVPTTANYCIMASTCAPILVQMDFPLVAAHFFVFYFGIVADITPPVALAAYAGAAIAKANPMKTGINATKLAIAAFIVPYIFAYSPAMLFDNVSSAFEVVQIVVSALIGLFGVAAALNGFVYKKIPMLFRLAMAAGGLCMMIPGTASDVVGLVMVGGIVLIQRMSARRLAA